MRRLLLILSLPLFATGDDRAEVERIGEVLPEDLPFVLVTDDVSALRQRIESLGTAAADDLTALATSFTARMGVDLISPVLEAGGSAAWFVTTGSSFPLDRLLEPDELFAGGVLVSGGDLAGLKDRFDQCADRLIAAGRFTRQEERVAQTDVTALVPVDGRDGRTSSVLLKRYAIVDGLFLVMLETPDVPSGRGFAGVADLIRSHPHNAVVHHPLFQRWRQRSSSPGGVFLHVDRSASGAQLPDYEGIPWGHDILTMGLVMQVEHAAVKRAAVAFQPLKVGLDIDASIDWHDGTIPSRLTRFFGSDGPLDLLRLVPARAASVLAFRATPEASGDMESALPETEQSESPERNSLTAPGDQFCLFRVPSAAEVGPDADLPSSGELPFQCCLLRPMHAATLEESVDRWLRDAGYEADRKTRQVGSHRISSLSPFPRIPRLPSLSMAMREGHWLIREDLALVATSSEAVDQVVRLVDDASLPSFATRQDFATALEDRALEDPHLLWYNTCGSERALCFWVCMLLTMPNMEPCPPLMDVLISSAPEADGSLLVTGRVTDDGIDLRYSVR